MGKKKTIVVLLLACLFICSLIPSSKALEEKRIVNRFNVVIVVDASKSMISTDPYDLRFQAIDQFIYLLADQGNYLGSVIFSTRVSDTSPVVPINEQRDKDRKSTFLRSVKPEGYTNIGAALLKATEMIETDGDKNIPSVIVLLSDGNTDMPSDDRLQESLDNKAEAIQKAREDKIAIYTVCLNANHQAEASEMQQISRATGGDFVEVTRAEDLRDVFNTFYNLIYGTSTITIVDEVFPDSGIVEKEFTVPSIGVEEVNIIIYGKTNSVTLYTPNGNDSGVKPSRISSFTMMKLTELIPGQWRIVTTGVPKDQIKINMVYNVDLEIEAALHAADDRIFEGDPAEVTAKLISSGIGATSAAQLRGYSAELQILNAYEEPIRSVPMEAVGNQFSAKLDLAKGVYKFRVAVSGYQLARESAVIGPLTVYEKPVAVTVTPPPGETAAPATPKVEMKPINSAPYAVETPIKKTVYVFPFKAPSYTIDMRTLAKDKEDAELRYRIESSSFLEGTDYDVTDGVINMYHFSLSEGSFDISATDTGGLSCHIEVKVRRVKVEFLVLICMGVGGLIVLAVVLFVAWRGTFPPIGGPVTVKSLINGEYVGSTKQKPRGKIYLNLFQLGRVEGLDTAKCYIQGAGGNGFVLLKTNKPVTCNGRTDKKIKITSGIKTIVSIPNSQHKLEILFECRNKSRRRVGPGGQAGARRTAPTNRPGAGGRSIPPRRPAGRP